MIFSNIPIHPYLKIPRQRRAVLGGRWGGRRRCALSPQEGNRPGRRVRRVARVPGSPRPRPRPRRGNVREGTIEPRPSVQTASVKAHRREERGTGGAQAPHARTHRQRRTQRDSPTGRHHRPTPARRTGSRRSPGERRAKVGNQWGNQSRDREAPMLIPLRYPPDEIPKSSLFTFRSFDTFPTNNSRRKAAAVKFSCCNCPKKQFAFVNPFSFSFVLSTFSTVTCQL